MATYRYNYTSQRVRKFLKFSPIFFILIAIIAGIMNIQFIRQFLDQASGEPANFFVDTQGVLGPMPRPWRHLAQGGEDHNWRLKPIASQVKALNPENIRIDHIYDFYDIVHGSPGNITFDFSKLDEVLDDIKSVGATPYISLSYMPPAISSGDIISKPVRWEDWQLVVQKTVEHISGERRTANVYYEVWNEPDLYGGWKYGGDKSYITLYNYAVRGATSARGVQPFKIGGPAITALYKNWFDAMAKNSIENNVRMDFFSWHRYTNDLEQYRKDMFDVHEWVQKYPQLEPTLQYHITEWGHDSNNNAGYDSAYGAAHTVAGAIEMIGYIDQAYVFEIQDGKDPAGQKFWGRWGLFTHNDMGGAAKSRYYGLRMIDRLGTQRLQIKGQGSFVKGAAAKTEDGVSQVVLSNFDPSGRNVESVPVTFQNIEPGQYTVTKEFLGGRRQVENVATTAAELQVRVAMPANTVGFIELNVAKTANNQ
jgi:hypothetical protein